MQDFQDVMRELQKLCKELNPVKSALATLAKREQTTPNAQAAAASLDKIATRIENVVTKYTPYMDWMQYFSQVEMPEYLTLTPLLIADTTQLEAEIAALRAEKLQQAKNAGQTRESLRHTAIPSTRQKNGNRLQSGFSDGGPKPHAGGVSANANMGLDTAAASYGNLLHGVCPITVPCAVQPENVRFVRNQLHLRVEMVEYLLATGRPELARHVAQSYGLPLMWFPALADEVRQEQLSGEVKATLHNDSSAVTTATASPAMDAARTPRVTFSPALGGAPSTGVLLPDTDLSRASFTVVTTSATATPQRPSSANVSGTPIGTHQQQPDGRNPASLPRVHNTSGESQRARSIGSALHPSHAGANTSASPLQSEQHPLPNLVARVASAGILLKDEYFDRMMLERLVQCDGFHTPEYLSQQQQQQQQIGRQPASNTSRNGGDGASRAAALEASSGSYHSIWSIISFGRRGTGEGPASLPDQTRRRVALVRNAEEESRHRFMRNPYTTDSVTAPSFLHSGPATTSSSPAELSSYNRILMERVRRVTRDHICIQSGSDAFDDAMMGVIEELLARTLASEQRSRGLSSLSQWERVNEATNGSGRAARASNGERTSSVDGAGAGSRHQRDSIQKPTLDLLSSAALLPEQLLAADEVWNNDILMIKRPTRYYCVYTGECMDGNNGKLVALPSGTIVSRIAVAEYLSEPKRMESGHWKTHVVCPPSDRYCEVTDVKQIFVT